MHTARGDLRVGRPLEHKIGTADRWNVRECPSTGSLASKVPSDCQRRSAAGRDCVRLPFAGHALELGARSFVELDPGARHRVFDRAGDDHFTGRGLPLAGQPKLTHGSFEIAHDERDLKRGQPLEQGTTSGNLKKTATDVVGGVLASEDKPPECASVQE